MDIAHGRKSGSRDVEKATAPKEKKPSQFQAMRARARAGTLVKRGEKKGDSIVTPNPERPQVKTVDVMRKQVTKEGIRSYSGNDPWARPKGSPMKPGAGHGG